MILTVLKFNSVRKMSSTRKTTSRKSEAKREQILSAAREIFDEKGLDGASLRSIATHAGYTPAALYFHFESKEAIYGEVLRRSLDALKAATHAATEGLADPEKRLEAAALGFFDFYLAHPRDLDLGFYLMRGGMRPTGLGPERDKALNLALREALDPIGQAAIDLGATQAEAEDIKVDCFAHASGLLLLHHSGRIRLFSAPARERMQAYVTLRLRELAG